MANHSSTREWVTRHAQEVTIFLNAVWTTRNEVTTEAHFTPALLATQPSTTYALYFDEGFVGLVTGPILSQNLRPPSPTPWEIQGIEVELKSAPIEACYRGMELFDQQTQEMDHRREKQQRLENLQDQLNEIQLELNGLPDLDASEGIDEVDLPGAVNGHEPVDEIETSPIDPKDPETSPRAYFDQLFADPRYHSGRIPAA